MQVYCFLDEGNDTSYVNEDVVEKLGLDGWKEKVIRDRSKIRGGEGWCKHGEGHGFSCKHKREGQTIWCMSLRGGHYFLCKDDGVKESIYNSSVVTVILL